MCNFKEERGHSLTMYLREISEKVKHRSNLQHNIRCQEGLI